MDLNKIKAKINNREIKHLDNESEYSVILPLIEADDEMFILFEKRAYNLKTQPGEISFPGGKIEDDETNLDAAIRETCEELNINNKDVNVIGKLDYIITPYNIIIYPFVAKLKINNICDINFNKDEVDDIFIAPLEFFIKDKPITKNIEIKTNIKKDFPFHLIPNGEDYKWRRGSYPVYFYTYKDKIIWGLTARIIKNFIDIINDNSL